ncbi:hypothetical protein VTN02DRAFT_3328 [Thermoascus thermophilus]
MPANAGTDTKNFLSFFLFWLLSLPAIWFPVHKIRHLFTAKAYFAPVAGVAFFAWAIHRAHGIGPIVHQPNVVHGSDLAWAVVKGIMSSIANFATLIVNDPDFSRFANRPRSALWSQLVTIPVGFALTSFIGIIVSSSSSVIFGQAIWNPLDLLTKFLEGASSSERFGVFVISTAFALAQLGTNIAANSVSAGTDMTALLPRFINIRRGGYVCAAVGLAMCPWHLMSSSNTFTTALSAYSVFLSSIAGVIVSDYYLVRRGFLDIQALYSARKRGPYFYVCGFSWHGYAAYLCGILINIVGFVGAVGRAVPVGAQYVYNVNFFGGFLVSAAMYYLFTRLVPVPATSDSWREVDIDVDGALDVITALPVAYGQQVATDEEESPESHSVFSAEQDEVVIRSTIKVPRDETKGADS